MNERYFILNIARNQINKSLTKAEKKVKETSAKLQQHNPFSDTKKKGIRLRINAECAAEERDRWENRLEIINKWLEEVKSNK